MAIHRLTFHHYIGGREMNFRHVSLNAFKFKLTFQLGEMDQSNQTHDGRIRAMILCGAVKVSSATFLVVSVRVHRVW